MRDYVICVPSRRRSAVFSPLVRALRRVRVIVDEVEWETYAAARLGVEITTHPGLPTIGAIRQWILDHTAEACVVMIDDDLQRVCPLVGTSRKPITEPAVVQRIIENGVNGAADLGLSLFGWSRNPNPAFFSSHNPFSSVSPCASAFGVIGRRIRFDESLQHGEDIDFTLKTLMVDRIVLNDHRFYFDVGLMGARAGGLQGVRNTEKIKADIETLSRRWGSYINLQGPSKAGCCRQHRTNTFSIAVKRKAFD